MNNNEQNIPVMKDLPAFILPGQITIGAALILSSLRRTAEGFVDHPGKLVTDFLRSNRLVHLYRIRFKRLK